MSDIKAVKEPPKRSMCSYPEAIFLLSDDWVKMSPEKQACVAATLATLFERDTDAVIDCLERGMA